MGAILLQFCSGCTIVRIEGDARLQLRGGVLKVAPADGAGAIGYSVSGLGLVPGSGGPTLGYLRERGVFVYDPQACRVVLIEPHAGNVEALRAVLAKNAGGDRLCVMGKGGSQ
ncbi:hypothetical protein [Novosphingobium huizhouense]|uniref:hypothetical protein n=1 Tax=Novosphingobium huizhouense TaxID=2866625 RepID=UPI001CD876BC|nr:hypothetical protein [Novosphingobium huizhouense]